MKRPISKFKIQTVKRKNTKFNFDIWALFAIWVLKFDIDLTQRRLCIVGGW